MQIITEFVVNNYIWLIMVIVLAILAIIGYYAEKNNLLKKEKTVNENVEVNNTVLNDTSNMSNDFVDEDLKYATDPAIINSPLNNIEIKNNSVPEIPSYQELNNNLDNNEEILENNVKELEPNIEEKPEIKKEPILENDKINNFENNYDDIFVDNTLIEQPIKNDDVFVEEVENNNQLEENNPIEETVNQEIDNNQLNSVQNEIDNQVVDDVFVNESNDEPLKEDENLTEETLKQDENLTEKVLKQDELENTITDEEILSQTKDLDTIKEELNQIVFETHLNEKYLKNVDDVDYAYLNLPGVENLTSTNNEKPVNK